MKLGSLFDGIAGFPYAASKFGIEAVWASEIIEPRIRITKKHFPNMKHLGDITKINGAEIEPVDVITMGSPCQDLSVAGKRAGLEGERSGLFMEGIRIVREMRNSTNGKYPKFLLWENVPGVFSSNKGNDFRAVLEEIGESKIPMPRSGRWATAGMVRTKTADIAWRVLDAQRWGTPQRRKRIFLVADFRGERAGEILFEPEDLRGDTSESRKAREEVACAIGDGVETTSFILGGYGEYIEGVGTLRKNCGDCGGGSETLVLKNIHNTLRAKAGMPKHEADWESLIIESRSQICYEFQHRCDVYREYRDLTPTLSAAGGMGGNNLPCVIACATKQISQNIGNNVALPLMANDYKEPQVIAVAVDCRNLVETEKSTPLQSKPNGGYSLNFQNPVRVGYRVRRLTPLETERLQGYPDQWTEGESDTQRYAAIGDSVAIPCVEWIMKRIAEVEG